MRRGASHNPGFDALRASLTLLVVMHHTAITYGAIGGRYYREVRTDALSSTLLVLFCTLNQALLMGLFFLPAGYFTPAAEARKARGRGAISRTGSLAHVAGVAVAVLRLGDRPGDDRARPDLPRPAVHGHAGALVAHRDVREWSAVVCTGPC